MLFTMVSCNNFDIVNSSVSSCVLYPFVVWSIFLYFANCTCISLQFIVVLFCSI
nr:MAG TPA: hypothetical protein [Inoviridae sp.]